MYDITLVVPSRPGTDHSALPIERALDHQVALRSKIALLLSRPLTFNNVKPVSFVKSEGKKPVESMIDGLVKMILITAEDKYDSSKAYFLLNQFPQQHIHSTLKSMNSDGSIVKLKSGNDRRVPGRGYHLSDKYLCAMKGPFVDNLISQASSFEEQIRSSEKGRLVFDELTNSGSMASILVNRMGGERADCCYRIIDTSLLLFRLSCRLVICRLFLNLPIQQVLFPITISNKILPSLRLNWP